MAEVSDTQYSSLQRYGRTIPQVFEIGPLGLGRALRDVTVLSDTVHKHHLNAPDIPEIAVKCYFDPADTDQLQVCADATAGSLVTFTVNVEEGNSPGENISFTAYVVNPQIESIGVDSDLVLSFSLKPQSLLGDLFL
jgi:hypothetical protein